MDDNHELPDVIPVFPLPGALLLPGTHLPLHIFEPRYRAMIEDAVDGAGLIGMIQPRGALGLAQRTPPADLAEVGCAGRLAQMSRTEDGRFFIVLEGVRRFRPLAEELGRAGYRRLRVSWSDLDSEHDRLWSSIDASGVLASLSRWVEPGPGAEALAELAPGRQINVLAAALPFADAEKQALLEAPDLASRRDLLVTLLEMGFADDCDRDPTVH